MAGGTAVGAADGLGHAEVPDLARCDEFGDDAGDVLSRNVRVHPVLPVQVNYVRADAAQRPVGRLRDVLGPLTRPGLAALAVEPLARARPGRFSAGVG